VGVVDKRNLVARHEWQRRCHVLRVMSRKVLRKKNERTALDTRCGRTLQGLRTASEESGMSERWALVEIMGKRSHIGKVSEATEFGRILIHVDELKRDGTFVPHRYAPEALFGYTPMSEDEARRALVPRWRTPCIGYYKESAVLAGACERCGYAVAEHAAGAPRLPAHEEEDAPPSSAKDDGDDDDEDDIPF
jgi:hypothetical protein